jgi:phosphoadenosine phosphosulfate reductase
MAPLDALAADGLRGRDLVDEARALNARFAGSDANAVIAAAVREIFCDRVALVSSFGAESVVLLHLVAEVDRAVPIIFLDTGKLFPETLEYRERLTDRLGLTDVRVVHPDPARLAAKDRFGALWMTNADLCCHIRKTEPLQRALTGMDAWFTGRKRFQNSVRSRLTLFEADGERIKVNPLANWAAADLKAYALRHNLPEHPLVSRGFPSIGCVPCTTKVAPGEDARAGRWRGTDKAECGIHTVLEIDGSGI